MDIEQLKLILETLAGAGEGAFIFAILWLSKGIVLAAMWLGFLAWVITKIANPIMENFKFIEELKKVMDFRGPLIRPEKNEILRVLKSQR